MKPLTKHSALVYFDHFNDDRSVYLADEADARIAELEADNDGLRNAARIQARVIAELEAELLSRTSEAILHDCQVLACSAAVAKAFAAIEAERDAAREDAERLREILASVEWCQPTSNSTASCPSCEHMFHWGHAEGCELRAAIDAARQARE